MTGLLHFGAIFGGFEKMARFTNLFLQLEWCFDSFRFEFFDYLIKII